MRLHRRARGRDLGDRLPGRDHACPGRLRGHGHHAPAPCAQARPGAQGPHGPRQRHRGDPLAERHGLDVDLWVRAPGDVPVGFWNQGSRFFNLLRDDLGATADATNLNYEIAYSRGIPGGEYVVNAHMYGPKGPESIPVKAVVSVRKPTGETEQLLHTDVVLRHHNEEVTAFRFRLTESGNLVPGSVTTVRPPSRDRGRVDATLPDTGAPDAGALDAKALDASIRDLRPRARRRCRARTIAIWGAASPADQAWRGGLARLLRAAVLCVVQRAPEPPQAGGPRVAEAARWSGDVARGELDEGRAIYLWLRLEGVDAPRYYVVRGGGSSPRSCRQQPTRHWPSMDASSSKTHSAGEPICGSAIPTFAIIPPASCRRRSFPPARGSSIHAERHSEAPGPDEGSRPPGRGLYSRYEALVRCRRPLTRGDSVRSVDVSPNARARWSMARWLMT